MEQIVIQKKKWKRHQNWRKKRNQQKTRDKSSLPDERHQYFERVSHRLQQSFETQEDKDIFIRNVLTETEGQEFILAQNFLVSSILEKLVTLGSKRQTADLMQTLLNNLELACVDQYASHVIQTLILQVLKFLPENTTVGDASQTNEEKTDEINVQNEIHLRHSLTSLILNYSDIIIQHLDNFIVHIYGSHIVRALIQTLSGCEVMDKKQITQKTITLASKDLLNLKGRSLKVIPVPEEFSNSLKRLYKKMQKMEKLNELILNNVATPVFQILLIVLNNTKPKWCKKMVKTLFENGKLLEYNRDVASDNTGSHLMEVLLHVSSDKQFNSMFEYFIKGRVMDFALDPIANFVLQRAISHCHNQEQLQCIFDEMCEKCEDILAVNHFGVIVNLAEACLHQKTRQSKFIKAMMKATHCSEPKSHRIKIAVLIAMLSTYDVLFETEEKDDSMFQINFHGSLILQHLLHFESPGHIVTSILDLTPTDLKVWITNIYGSRIIEAFINGSFVGDKNKSKLIEKLKDHFVDIACCKFGSRVFDTIWASSSLKDRYTIAEELAPKEAKLNSSEFGIFVAKKCGLFHYKKRQQDWKEIQNAQIKKCKLFKDLLDEEDEEIENMSPSS